MSNVYKRRNRVLPGGNINKPEVLTKEFIHYLEVIEDNEYIDLVNQEIEPGLIYFKALIRQKNQMIRIFKGINKIY